MLLEQCSQDMEGVHLEVDQMQYHRLGKHLRRSAGAATAILVPISDVTRRNVMHPLSTALLLACMAHLQAKPETSAVHCSLLHDAAHTVRVNAGSAEPILCKRGSAGRVVRVPSSLHITRHSVSCCS